MAMGLHQAVLIEIHYKIRRYDMITNETTIHHRPKDIGKNIVKLFSVGMVIYS